MSRLYFLIILSIFFYILTQSRKGRNSSTNTGYQDPSFREDKAPTMFDVRELLIHGEKELAIEIYQEIFNVGIHEAREAVEAIERSIQPKDFER